MNQSNRPCRMEKCFICEETLDLKDYYLYMCSYCKIETSYCLKCNKAIEIIFGSIYFKCVSCLYIIKISTRETYFYSREDDLLSSMFRDREDIRLMGNFPSNPLNRWEVGNGAMMTQNFHIHPVNNFSNPTQYFNPAVFQQFPQTSNSFNINQSNNFQGFHGTNNPNQFNNQEFNSNRFDNKWKKENNFDKPLRDNFQRIEKPDEREKFGWGENGKMFYSTDNNNIQMNNDPPLNTKNENEAGIGNNINFFSSLMQNRDNNGSFNKFNPVNPQVFTGNSNFRPFQQNSNTPIYNGVQQFNFMPNSIQANETNQNSNLILNDNNMIPNTHSNSFGSFMNNNITPYRQFTSNDESSVHNDQINMNIPQMQTEISMIDKDKLPNFSVLQSKSSRNGSKNVNDTVKRISFKKEDSEFAGYNREESTRPRSTLTPKYLANNRDYASSTRLNQSDIISTERNSYLPGSIPDLNYNSNQINLNNTISHFNN